MKKTIREKKHRLEPEIYTGQIIVAFTLCVKDRREIFVNIKFKKVIMGKENFKKLLKNSKKRLILVQNGYFWEPGAYLAMTLSPEKFMI